MKTNNTIKANAATIVNVNNLQIKVYPLYRCPNCGNIISYSMDYYNDLTGEFTCSNCYSTLAALPIH